MTKRIKKIPKVKISEIDLKSFLYEQLEVDPYWDDLYNPNIRNIKNKNYGEKGKKK